jgi:small subunit ribosomal protein S9
MTAENINLGYGTGRRKDAVARVFLRTGTGKITVNGRTPDEYFPRETLRMLIHKPLDVLGVRNRFDFYVTTSGGGVAGQAGAVQLGIARALVAYDEANNPPSEEEGDDGGEGGDGEGGRSTQSSYRRKLRAEGSGLLTRDARTVERKKYGLRKARKRPQYSKR